MQQTIFNADMPRFVPYLQENMRLSKQGVEAFQEYILSYYNRYGREFSWRSYITPYRILVSEIMLQQTQTQRVIHKFASFIQAFPSFKELADSSFHDVLAHWQGLGYNRRARGLHRSAQKVVYEYAGYLPADPQILQTFPSIGPNTAASIATFAYNTPTVFFETNIRSVFIYHFFPEAIQVSDEMLHPLVEQTLYRQHPRIWYYALMDYGVALKQAYGNFHRRSKHYTTQSRFEGSERQIRGMILRALTQHKALSGAQLCQYIPREEKRVIKNARSLMQDGLLQEKEGVYSLVD